ncbi:GNAT family N-acetyltransferase [Paenibacillus sp. DMB20]|uniref:GNAT family N-acetyltransferase n=1 Tax=Paenibacillus sp. DMB20 TaxID=1642570 RepID=UPI00062793DD|nr:N-acetyltransferase [Paenibacillus sp. DMB20]KKO53869.1 GCN5 family acetyltransferase [Paenibacillus sp. DMB20]
MIRTEQCPDYPHVDQMLKRAFKTGEEARLVEGLRASQDYIPELSLVYETDGSIAGHILFSEASVQEDSSIYRVAALGPLAVDPAFQRSGIGSALMKEGLERCRSYGFPLVFLLGHPEYYPRFGFLPARRYGFELKQFQVSDDVFMVCELEPGALDRLQGEFRFSSVFESLH